MTKKNKIIITLLAIIVFAGIVGLLIWSGGGVKVDEFGSEVARDEYGDRGLVADSDADLTRIEGEEGRDGEEFQISNFKFQKGDEEDIYKAEVSEEEIEAHNLKVLAADFVERWGSHSGDTNQREWDPAVASTEAMAWQGGFYGVTTKPLRTNIKEIDENSAVLRVMCQKTIEENGDIRVVYEEVEVEMVKEGEGNNFKFTILNFK